MWMRDRLRRPARLRVGLVAGIAVNCVVAAGLAGAAGASAAVDAHSTVQLQKQVSVTMQRDGVPHIVAKNFTALGYGEGYEFAADNLCTFANDVVTLEGQRSKYFGPTGTAVNYSAGVSETNLQSDLYWRYVAAQGTIQAELKAKAPNGLIPQVREVYSGFIAGYNAYLKSGKLKDPTCKGKAWVHPIDMTDMLLRGYQIVTEASSAQFVTAYDGATAPIEHAFARVAAQHVSVKSLKALGDRFSSATRSEGSNGIGLGSSDTRTKTGMVLANPHFPWRGTERFWMVQLDVPGQYDVEGGTLEGFPMIGIGFNRDLAWTHTVSTDMRFVVYKLALVPDNPTEYTVGGKIYKMKATTVTVKYGGKSASHTFYSTRWGTVATIPSAGYEWSNSTAYAIDDVTADGGARAANEYYYIGRAKTVAQLYSVESKWLAIPTFNTIAADDHGEAYYGDVGATPAVSAAEMEACMPTGLPQEVYALTGIITLDGSTVSCAPADTKGTPEAGIFPGKDLPHIFRLDYVENSNDSYWLANPQHPLTGFSPIIGLADVQQDGRTRLANAMIAARVKGSDGLGAAKFTLTTLQKMWSSDKSQLAVDVLAPLVKDCIANPVATASNGKVVNLKQACDALSKYNGTGKLNAIGGWLFTVWAYLDPTPNATTLLGPDEFYATPFDPAKPLTTPTGLNTTTGQPLVYLADAVQNLTAHHLSVYATIGQVQYAPQSKSIAIPGCFGESTTQQMGCFNAIYSPIGASATDGPSYNGAYGQVNFGSSLVLTTELAKSGPLAEGILTYSQASDPTSPWYKNMTKLYSEGKWVTFPFTAAQLSATHPFKTVTLTEH